MKSEKIINALFKQNQSLMKMMGGYVNGNVPNRKDVPIEEAGFSRRVYNILANQKIKSISQLEGVDRSEILCWRNCGRSALYEIERITFKFGVKLATWN